MNKYISGTVFFFALVLFGTTAWTQSSSGAAGEYLKRFSEVEKARRGMSREEVLGLLGDKIVTGYELVDVKGDQYQALTVMNPFRTETFVQANKIFVVDYYFIGIKAADGQIKDEELVPLVFLNNRLLGTGWDFFNKKIKK